MPSYESQRSNLSSLKIHFKIYCIDVGTNQPSYNHYNGAILYHACRKVIWFQVKMDYSFISVFAEVDIHVYIEQFNMSRGE